VSFWNNSTVQTFNITGIPAGATVVKALLFWGCECNSASDLANITFAGNPITGTSTTPGADGATLYVIYCDPAETTRTITVYAGAEFVNSASATWTQGGFTATTSPQARASITVGDPQDGLYNPGYFNGNYIGSFDGSVPGNHYGYWEADVSSWVPSSATSVSWELQSSGSDCISPNVSVLAITSTDPETFDCSTGYDDPVLIDEAGRVIARGHFSVYDASGRLVYSGEGSYTLPKGIFFILSEGKLRRVVRR